MSEVHEPSHDHARFDALCAEAEDWAMLPSVDAPTPAAAQWLQATAAEKDGEESETSLDGQILAGLISPW